MATAVALLTWVGNTPSSIALRESIWAYPIVETVHVLGIAVFVGFAVILDLRLVDLALRRTAVSEIIERIGRWIWTGFIVMALSGLLLFFADPVKFSANPFFQAKLVLLAVAAANAAIFHGTVYRRIAAWDADVAPPRAARLAGWISLTVWAAVVTAGRLIAFYNA